MREGDATREGKHDKRVGEKAQTAETPMIETKMTETTMTETTMTTKTVTVTMAMPMNDDKDDGNERRRFNNQSM